MAYTLGLNKGYIGLIILIAIVAVFSLWWIVSIPNNKIYAVSKSNYLFSNITISAKNASVLSKFYTQVFGCNPVKDNTPLSIHHDSKGVFLSLLGYEGRPYA